MTTEREIRDAIAPLYARIAAIDEKFTSLVSLFELVIARTSDPTRVTVAEAAKALRISRTEVRRRFARYIERRPGVKGDFIPVDAVYRGITVPLEVAKRAVERQLKATA
jgi:hypothetical protein